MAEPLGGGVTTTSAAAVSCLENRIANLQFLSQENIDGSTSFFSKIVGLI